MYGSCASSNVILIQRDRNCLLHAVSLCIYNTKDGHSEIRLSTVKKLSISGNISSILSWIYQQLLELRIIKTYSLQMGIWWKCPIDMRQPSEFMVRIAPIPLIMFIHIT